MTRWRDRLDLLRADLRYAARTLRRDAGFTTFALAIMALGIGASATVFSLLNGVLLRPMPFRDPGRLVWIGTVSDNGVDEWRIQVDHLVDMTARSRALAGTTGYFAYYSNGDAVLAQHGDEQRLTRVPVACNFFPFLGVTPRLGRSFRSEECLDNSAPTTMLSDRMWRDQFNADPAIVGRTITLNNVPVTVIGVLPASFDFGAVFTPGAGADLFVPYPLSESNSQTGNSLGVIGRLTPGATLDQARAELATIGRDLTAQFPRRNSIRPRVTPLEEHVNGRFRPPLIVLAFAVALVMLIVALNLASLQVARLAARQRELAVRLALGASRGRLLRQTLAESLVLSGGGATLGIVIAVLGTRYIARLQAFDIPMLSRVSVDVPSLAMAALVAIVAGTIVALLPGLRRPGDPTDALKEGTRGTTRGGGLARLRSALVVSEIAAALVLLVASSLLLRSFVRVLDARLGFTPDHLERLRVDPATHMTTGQQANTYYDDVLRRIRGLPGVSAASVSDMLPFTGDRSWGIPAEGKAYQRGSMPEGHVRIVGEDYFRTMGIPLLEGRDFGAGDALDAPPVVIINQTMAHTLWPDRDAVGQRIQQATPVTVVGVVADVRFGALEQPFLAEVYFPFRQRYFRSRVDLVVRSALPLSQLAAAARVALPPIARSSESGSWTPMQDVLDRAASPRRFVVVLLSGFAIFAVLLATLGIYALISYGVTQRRQEIGIRLALGATAADVRRAVLRGSLTLAVVGTAVGAACALVAIPAIRGMLFGVTWADPASFVGAAAILFLVAATAGFLPARRAARVDPSSVLRSD